MSKRKNIPVRDLIMEVNRLNRESTVDPKIRMGFNILLDNILHTTGNYHGYTYLEQANVPDGQEPGVILGETPDKNVFPDESRRSWLVAHHLRSDKPSIFDR